MKSFFILLFISSLTATAQTGTRYFYLKPKQKVVTNTIIDSAITVLNKRLSNQGYHKTSVLYDTTKKQFVITANDFIDSTYIRLFLIKPFSILLNEVYTLEEVIGFLSQGKADKAREQTLLNFYSLLNISPANFQSFKYASYLGMLNLKDTVQFRKLTKSLQLYLPTDIYLAFPQKLSTPSIPAIEIYGLRKNKNEISINALLIDATSGTDNAGHPSIKFELNGEGKKLFAAMTEKNINRPIVITIDNRVCMAPNVASKIEGGVVEISGNFTKKETGEIAGMLMSGLLPVELVFAKE